MELPTRLVIGEWVEKEPREVTEHTSYAADEPCHGAHWSERRGFTWDGLRELSERQKGG